MRGILVTVISLVLVCSISIQAVAAPLPGPPDSIGVGQSADQWRLNGTEGQLTPSGSNTWSVSWSGFSALPSSADVDIMFEGYYGDNSASANFLGGQAYQFYWEGGFVASSFVPIDDMIVTVFYPSTYSILYGSNIFTYVSTSGNSLTYLLNGVSKTISGSYGSYSETGFMWNRSGYLNFYTSNYVFNLSEPVSSTPVYGSFSSVSYDNLDSITMSFPDVTGSLAGGYTFEVPSSNFSWYNGQYKVNAILSIPYGTDCADYFYIEFKFSSPASGSVSSITFTVENMSFGGMGETDASLGELQDISNQLVNMAQALEGLAQDSTVSQCLDAIRSIYNFLSGNILPLLQQIETNQDTLYTFLSSNLLPQIVTQLSNIKASIDTGFDNTIAAIEAQTQALITYLNEAFQDAGESIEDTNQNLDSAIGSYDEAEDALVGDFNAQWSDFDFNSFLVDATLGNAFTWVSARFVDLWNALGGEVQLLVTIPCVLGVGMMVVTGSSRFFGRSSNSDDDEVPGQTRFF